MAPGRKIQVPMAARRRQAERLAKSPIEIGWVAVRDGGAKRNWAVRGCQLVQPHDAGGCITRALLVKYFRQPAEEALILLRGAIANADVARPAEGLAGAHGNFALGEAGEDLSFVSIA